MDLSFISPILLDCTVATTGGTAGGDCCKFPFTYSGVKYTSCASAGHHRPWCFTDAAPHSKWGNCKIGTLMNLFDRVCLILKIESKYTGH